MFNFIPSKFDIFAGIVILVLIAISMYSHRRTVLIESTKTEGLGINELIKSVRRELIQSAKEMNGPEMFQVKTFDLEIKFVVTEKQTESGKIEYEFVTLGADTTVGSEKVQTIKLQMSAIEGKGEVPPTQSPTGTGKVIDHNEP